MEDIPTFIAARIRGTNQMQFVCPKCGQKNSHGCCGPVCGGGDGHRVSHCPCWPSGYYVREQAMVASEISGAEFLSAVMKTCGEYATEDAAVADLIAKINCNHWAVHREVNGWLLQPRSFSDGKLNLRVDVLLEPTEYLQMCGWRWGPIAIECKRAGSQVGSALCQIMDYTRCVWSMPNGFQVMSRLCFLWHFKPPGGTVASVMVNNRIGGAFLRDYKRDRVVLMFNSTVAYEDCDDDQTQRPRIATELRGGSKTGSR